MKTILTTCVAIAIIVATGVVHGIMSHRWVDSNQQLQQAAARLKQLPKVVGEWKSDQEFEISERQLAIGEIDGYLSRTYVNQAAGRSVNVIILCGRPGPISVHTPDICFRGQGMQAVRKQANTTVQTKDSVPVGEFWQCDFVKTGAASLNGIRAYWTWATHGDWSAPTNPRIAFAGESFLYKMYVTQAVNLRDEQSDDELDPAQDFITHWVPAIDKILFSANVSSEPSHTNVTRSNAAQAVSFKEIFERTNSTDVVLPVKQAGAPAWFLNYASGASSFGHFVVEQNN